MQPYLYLQRLAKHLDDIRTPDEINRVLDELDFIQEALDPEHQPLATRLIEVLMDRLGQCPP